MHQKKAPKHPFLYIRELEENDVSFFRCQQYQQNPQYVYLEFIFFRKRTGKNTQSPVNKNKMRIKCKKHTCFISFAMWCQVSDTSRGHRSNASLDFLKLSNLFCFTYCPWALAFVYARFWDHLFSPYVCACPSLLALSHFQFPAQPEQQRKNAKMTVTDALTEQKNGREERRRPF